MSTTYVDTRHEIDGVTFTELDPREAWWFRTSIQEARDAHRHGAAVHVYEMHEYAGMRLFLTEDSLAGFALNGDDIVSGFVHPDAPRKGLAQTMLRLAIHLGGRRTDCFDPVLPALYAPAGMRAIARVAWDDDYAPEGWDYDRSGRPDVVFMVYDPYLVGHEYRPGSGIHADTYDEGVEIQSAYLMGLDIRTAA